jgi:hypothetical protein
MKGHSTPLHLRNRRRRRRHHSAQKTPQTSSCWAWIGGRWRHGDTHDLAPVQPFEAVLLVRLVHFGIVGRNPVAGSPRRGDGWSCQLWYCRPVPTRFPQRRVLGGFAQILPQPIHAVARKYAEYRALVIGKLGRGIPPKLLEFVSEETLDTGQAEVGESRASAQQADDALVMVSNLR